MQGPWPELYPFADPRALGIAKRRELGNDARTLARHVRQADFPRLVAALLRTDLANDYDTVLANA